MIVPSPILLGKQQGFPKREASTLALLKGFTLSPPSFLS